MSDPALSQPLKYRQESNRAVVIFTTLVLGLFAGMFLLGFFSKLSHLGADEWLLGIFGLVLLGLDILIYRFLTAPGIVLTDTSMLVTRFFRDQTILYADMAELSSYLERIHPPRINGRRMPPRVIHRLLVKTRDTREFRMTLPRFGTNGDLIEALEKRSGKSVGRLPDVDKGR